MSDARRPTRLAGIVSHSSRAGQHICCSCLTGGCQTRHGGLVRTIREPPCPVPPISPPTVSCPSSWRSRRCGCNRARAAGAVGAGTTADGLGGECVARAAAAAHRLHQGRGAAAEGHPAQLVAHLLRSSSPRRPDSIRASACQRKAARLRRAGAQSRARRVYPAGAQSGAGLGAVLERLPERRGALRRGQGRAARTGPTSSSGRR